MIEQGFNKHAPIPSGFATLSEQEPAISKTKNSISGGVLLSSNHCNSIIFKETQNQSAPITVKITAYEQNGQRLLKIKN